MNLPNKFTTLRMLLIPVFLLFVLGPLAWRNYGAALALFILASITDFLDGYIARKHGLVTDFGKLMDPLADKLLVSSALLAFIELGAVPALVVIVIIMREFLVTAIRSLAVQKGIVIAADIFGKIKTVLQIVWISAVLLQLTMASVEAVFVPLGLVNFILMVAATALTVFSGLNYVVKNIALFRDR